MQKFRQGLLRILWILSITLTTPATGQDVAEDGDRVSRLKGKIEAYQEKRDGLLGHMVKRHKDFYEGYLSFFNEQKKIINREKAKLDDLLTIPTANRPNWSVDEINSEISNSAQNIKKLVKLEYLLDLWSLSKKVI